MPSLLQDLAASAFTMYDAWFQEEYNSYQGPDYGRLFMTVNLGDNEGDRIDLNWLGAAPQLQEWVDEKRPKGFNLNDLQLIVRDFEATVKVNKNAIKDGKWRQYESRIREMARNARRHPWKLMSDLILNGAGATLGTAYDGQYFFDSDHSEGSSGTQSNLYTGSGTSLSQITADWFGLKKQMMTLKDDQGEIWGDIEPDFVVIPPQLEEVFSKLKEQVVIGNGETNIMRGRFDYQVEPRLTDANDWYGFHTKGAMKPFILLERQSPTPVNLIDPESSERAFMRKELLYSVEARREAGYGLWQYGAKVTNA